MKAGLNAFKRNSASDHFYVSQMYFLIVKTPTTTTTNLVKSTVIHAGHVRVAPTWQNSPLSVSINKHR